MITYDWCIIEREKKTWHTAGKLGGVLPNGCSRSAELLAVTSALLKMILFSLKIWKPYHIMIYDKRNKMTILSRCCELFFVLI